MFRRGVILFLGAFFALTPALIAAGKGKYFILVVWDGMRPDYVSPELTPTLHALRESGVWFANHRSVFPTSTEVNGAVLATGAFPQRNGVSANKEYRREIDPLKQFGTESLTAVRRGDALTGGNYLKVPTVAELVQKSGRRTAVVGAKPVALLHDRLPRPDTSANAVWFANGCLPESLFDSLTNQFGSFTAAASPNTARDNWATRCLTERFWKKEIPRYSVLWLSEPDFSQHHHGPGSPQALEAIRSCDRRLASVLAELDRRGVQNETDIFVVSDHGFSTIAKNGDVAAILRAAGINARPAWDETPRPDHVVVVGNGGSVFLYVAEHSLKVIEKIVATLQQTPTVGVIFTRNGIPGTFKLAEVKLDSETAPDVLVASAWNVIGENKIHQRIEMNNDGYKEYQPGCGMHVTLSPTDLHNTAVAVGPDFRRGMNSTLASGNVDIVPTLLWLMGITPPQPLDGRVLGEALTIEAPPSSGAKTFRRDARHELSNGVWEQYLKFTEVNGVRYLDEGNGSWQPTKVSPSQKPAKEPQPLRGNSH
jgi:arylsulfatase A-like enzyme